MGRLFALAVLGLLILPTASALASGTSASERQTLFCDQSLNDFVNTTLHIATITANTPRLSFKQYRSAVSEATAEQKRSCRRR